ncbi:terminase small subunit [Yoonia sp. 208BN28-4]|uniref:terminase small subunit n=1 Tax=Yoonia sp. 208BN28-4 TaxID=3126505 RepID=UPI00309EEF0D
MDTIRLGDGTTLDIAAYPLPDGVEDVVLNRGQLATAMNVSEQTITNWMRAGLPLLSQGSNGQSYEFQLAHCYAWRMRRDADERARRAKGDAQAQQLALTFLNPSDIDDDEPFLTAKQIKEWAEAEYQRNRAAEQRGDLVRVDSVKRVMEQLVVDFCSAINVLPDFAEQEFGLSAAQAQVMQRRCDGVIEEAAMTIQRSALATGKVVSMTSGRDPDAAEA